MKLKISTITTLCLLILFLMPALLHAQPDMGSGDVDDAPVDGGLSLLVAAGVGYGVKKMRSRKN